MAVFDKFTDRARKVLQLAQEEAVRLNHNCGAQAQGSPERRWARRRREVI